MSWDPIDSNWVHDSPKLQSAISLPLDPKAADGDIDAAGLAPDRHPASEPVPLLALYLERLNLRQAAQD